MTTKKMIVASFNKRVFDESYSRIYTCLSMLSEESIWYTPNSQIPPIGNLILHVCGNARQWILAGIGSEKDNRKRDQEFVIQKNIRKSELIFVMEALRGNIQDTLAEMPPSVLTTPKKIQGFDETGFSILIHVIEHFSYHTGQITLLTKLITQKDTGYFLGMNLNQLN